MVADSSCPVDTAVTVEAQEEATPRRQPLIILNSRTSSNSTSALRTYIVWIEKGITLWKPPFRIPSLGTGAQPARLLTRTYRRISDSHLSLSHLPLSIRMHIRQAATPLSFRLRGGRHLQMTWEAAHDTVIHMASRIVRPRKKMCMIEQKEAKADLPGPKAREKSTARQERTEVRVVVMEGTTPVGKATVEKRAVQPAGWLAACSSVTNTILSRQGVLVDSRMSD